MSRLAALQRSEKSPAAGPTHARPAAQAKPKPRRKPEPPRNPLLTRGNELTETSGGPIQREVEVGEADNSFEREAKTVADHVLRMPAGEQSSQSRW
jgi:hypothetical protein